MLSKILKSKLRERLRKKYIVLMCFSLVFSIASFAVSQSNTLLVKGKAIDNQNGSALPGVSIIIKGTTTGTISDLDGNFELEAKTGDVLVFSFIGYLKVEVTLKDQTFLSVSLKEDVVGLEEVVVIGYGTQKRSDLTGSISSVSEEELKAVPVTSIDQALQGKAAGLIVQQTSGSPAGGVSVLVRGASSVNASSQPLFVIDGVPLNDQNTTEIANIQGGQGGQRSNPLASLSPDDIESIEILKDASAAAIYGTRGANGVVLISTKRGKEGTTNFSFNSYVGIQQLPRKLDVLNTEDYARYRLIQHMNEINKDYYPLFTNDLDYTSSDIPFSTLHPDSFIINTNWQDEAYRNAIMNNYHLVANGGSKNMSYSISGGYYKVDGILVGSSYDRFSMKANTDTRLKEWFDLGNSLMVSYSNENMSFNDAYYNGGFVERILQQRPDMRVRDEDGNFAGPPPGLENAPDNPIAAELEKQDDNVTSRIIGNIYAQINLSKNLSIKSTFGADLSNGRTTLFNPSVNRGAYYDETAEMQENIKQNLYWNFNNLITYNKDLGSHNISLMGGWERSYVKWDAFSAFRDDFPSNETRSLNLGSEVNMSNNSYAGHKGLESVFGRGIFSFADILIFTSTHRLDGTSLFSEERRRGYFPSYALAWKASNMDFIKSVTFINFLKLRIGYGVTGNDNVTGIPYLPQLSPVLTSFNNTIKPAYEPAGKENADVHWESVITYNIGLDINFLENRFQFTTDFYNKKSEEMLIELPLPISVAPFGFPWSNSAEMVNKGFEISITSNNITGEFTWTTTGTYSFNKNVITELKETEIQQRITTQDPMITNTIEGYPVAQFYGFVTNGLFQDSADILSHAYQNGAQPGDIKFKDLNGDGTIDDNDKTYIGNPIPIHVAGLTNTFSYKGIDFSFFIQSMIGNKVFNWINRRMEGMKGTQNQYPTVLETYIPEDIYLSTPQGNFLVAEKNIDTDMPRMTLQDRNNNTRISDRYVEDASFVRLQSLTLGYTLPEHIANQIKAKRLRIYITGKNIYTLTKYTGYDPEHGPLNNNPLLTGIEIGNYPIPRSWIIGVNLDF
ncbi:SusC/RagA family TonB-linked outer membrane protein [Bacteroidota bacterium]